MKFYLNGKIAEEENTFIKPTDRGLTLGDGLFETIVAKNGELLKLEAHFARLRSGSKILQLPVPLTDEQLAEALLSVLKANNLTNAVLRLTLTRGLGERGIALPKNPVPTLLISASEMPLSSTEPLRLIIAKSTRRNQFSPLSRCKSLNFLDNIIARQEAVQKNANDAILLNTYGRIAETTIANLFVKIDGKLFTPPVAEGALAGVMRADIIKDFSAEEKPLDIEDLWKASEVFTTNAIGIRHVSEIDGKVISSWK